MKYWIMQACCLIVLSLPTPLVADDGLLIQTEHQKFSYTLGYQVGGQLAEQIRQGGLDLDPDAFAQAIADVLSARPPVMTAAEMEATLATRKSEETANQSAAAESGRLRGETFEAEYSQRDGVVATASGLQYRVIENGDGRSPDSGDTVVVHYVGRLTDGTEFDSSRTRGTPATFSLSGIIPGWQEVLQLMREGDTWEVVIPSDLAYGVEGAGTSIGPNETLVFEIELISVK
jgi:FKBP-type peptidyl-prolyl cis-trans isomerase FklB